MRDEIAALPGPEHAVMLLERLATEKRPLRAAILGTIARRGSAV
jgi:hypothetical protein